LIAGSASQGASKLSDYLGILADLGEFDIDGITAKSRRFRREAQQGTYVMHRNASRGLGCGGIGSARRGDSACTGCGLVGHQHTGHGRAALLGEIKQRRPDLPVMMVTAYGDDERRRRARELGAFEFINKPVDFDQLKEQLRQLVN
jgi:CheY-like chemotaxis protein